MKLEPAKARPSRNPATERRARKSLRRLVEFQGIRRLPLNQYRDHVKELYDGPAGAVLALASLVSLHEPLIGQMLRTRKFDVSRRTSILDVGSGAGQILGHLLKESQPDATLVAFDLSHQMLRRARQRLKSRRPSYLAGDLLHLPFADGAFDCVTCGWVLEHLPDPAPGLRELHRVLKPGGSMLILTTEDTFSGAMCSRTWKCRTHNRHEFRRVCEEAGLVWKEQFYFTPIHRFLKMGGILVELAKPLAPTDPTPPRVAEPATAPA